MVPTKYKQCSLLLDSVFLQNTLKGFNSSLFANSPLGTFTCHMIEGN